MALFHEQPVELPSVNICAQLLGGGGGALRAEIYCLIKCMIVYGSCALASPHDTNCQKRELESPVSPTWKPTTGSQEDPPRVSYTTGPPTTRAQNTQDGIRIGARLSTLVCRLSAAGAQNLGKMDEARRGWRQRCRRAPVPPCYMSIRPHQQCPPPNCRRSECLRSALPLAIG